MPIDIDDKELEKRGYIIKDWTCPFIVGADYDFQITASPIDTEFLKWSLNNTTKQSKYKKNQFSLKTKRSLK